LGRGVSVGRGTRAVGEGGEDEGGRKCWSGEMRGGEGGTGEEEGGGWRCHVMRRRGRVRGGDKPAGRSWCHQVVPAVGRGVWEGGCGRWGGGVQGRGREEGVLVCGACREPLALALLHEHECSHSRCVRMCNTVCTAYRHSRFVALIVELYLPGTKLYYESHKV